jgi:hypothetical protein
VILLDKAIAVWELDENCCGYGTVIFWEPIEKERMLLEAVTRALVKGKLIERTMFVL